MSLRDEPSHSSVFNVRVFSIQVSVCEVELWARIVGTQVPRSLPKISERQDRQRVLRSPSGGRASGFYSSPPDSVRAAIGVIFV
jgi:hypothetical protein